jgi:hypothetical protein
METKTKYVVYWDRSKTNAPHSSGFAGKKYFVPLTPQDYELYRYLAKYKIDPKTFTTIKAAQKFIDKQKTKLISDTSVATVITLQDALIMLAEQKLKRLQD